MNPEASSFFAPLIFRGLSLNLNVSPKFRAAAHRSLPAASAGVRDGRVQAAAGLRGGIPRPAGRAAGHAPHSQPTAAGGAAGTDQPEPATTEPGPAGGAAGNKHGCADTPTKGSCHLPSLLTATSHPQVSHARIAGLESQVETLARSEIRLQEQVFTLQDEKEQLARTVTHLQDLVNSLGIRIPPGGLALLPPSGKPSLEEAAASDSVLHPAAPPEGS